MWGSSIESFLPSPAFRCDSHARRVERSRRRCGWYQALLSVFVVLVTQRADAQIINVLYEANQVQRGVSGKLNAAGEWLSGNTETLRASGAAGLRLKSGRHMGLLMAEATYGNADGDAFIDRELGHARYRNRLSELFQLEAFLQGDRDPLRRRVARVVFGAGPRLELIRGPRVWTALGLAYMPEYEQLSQGEFTDSSRQVWHQRLSGYVSHSIALGESVQVSNTIYVQPSLDHISNVRGFADLSIQLQLRKNLSLTFAHSLQVDTQPPDTVRPADATRRMSATWTF